MKDFDKRIYRANQLLIAASILLFLVTLTQWVNAQAPFNTPDNIGAGNCLEFDGSNDFVDCSDLGSLGTSYTAETWINLDDVSSGHILAYARDGGSTTSHQGINISVSSNQIRFYVRDGSGTASILSNAINAGEWYHIAGVRNGNDIELFINGVSQGTANRSFGTINSNLFGIGAIWHDGLNQWVTFADGKIDEVRIWSTAKTQAQIRDNMCHQLSGTEPGLVGYWNMNEGDDNTCAGGEDVCDQSGNGNHGTLEQ